MNIRPPNNPVNETQCITLVRPIISNSLAIVGDVPYNGLVRLPFANSHYGTLANLFRKIEVDFGKILQANLLGYYPPNGHLGIEQKWQIEQSLGDIKTACTECGVKVLVLLGRQTLHWFKPANSGVDEERGAPFLWNGFVCLATYHPKELFAEWHNLPIVEADFVKALRYIKDGWHPPVLNITYAPTFNDCVHFLRSLIERKPYISTDWESVDSPRGPYSLATCIGIGINGTKAFTIPFVKEGNKSYFTLQEECVIWRLVAQVLETCPQLGQNGLHYDHWFAAYWHKILMNVVDDAMFAHWEVYTELPKSLAFLNSLYCDNEYWKDDRKLALAGKVPRDREFLYNGRDTCITIQSAVEIGKELKELPTVVRDHYRFNVRVSRVFQYMSLRGCVVNREKLKQRIGSLEIEAEVAGRRLEDEAKRKINVRSYKQMQDWLYKDLLLPVQTKAVKQDDGSYEDKETSDFLTLAYLARQYPSIQALMTAAKQRLLLKRLSSLNAIKLGPSGECYWNFNLVGTDSGRASGYKPYNGLGVQPQNVDRRDRDLFEAGRGMAWAKCDLEGADSWSVAGQLEKLGDGVMLRDLKAGIKPAMILALAYAFGHHLINETTEVLLPLVKQHKKYFKDKSKEGGNITYETCKSVSHGSNYMMQAPTMHMTIFRKTKAELYVPVKKCEELRLLYLKRYKGLERLYEHIPTIINSHGYMDCPSGMRRLFFGRNDNHRTRVGLSLIPQNNTSYAVNRALHNLYYLPYNRETIGSLKLIMQPLNQVHDEIDLAFSENKLEQVRDIFTKATDFTSEVWGCVFKIPFDANYGSSWGDCETPLNYED